jgi:hypothetical protein
VRNGRRGNAFSLGGGEAALELRGSISTPTGSVFSPWIYSNLTSVPCESDLLQTPDMQQRSLLFCSIRQAQLHLGQCVNYPDIHMQMSARQEAVDTMSVQYVYSYSSTTY